MLMRMWNMEMEHTPCHHFLSNKSFRPLTKPQIGLPIFKAVPFITLIHLLRDGNPHLPAITTYSHTHSPFSPPPSHIYSQRVSWRGYPAFSFQRRSSSVQHQWMWALKHPERKTGERQGWAEMLTSLSPQLSYIHFLLLFLLCTL